jgi:hypothetical protein
LRLRALRVVTVGRVRRFVTADGVAVTLASWRPCGCQLRPWRCGAATRAIPRGGHPLGRPAAASSCCRCRRQPPESGAWRRPDLASVPQGRTFRTSDAVRRRLPSVARALAGCAPCTAPEGAARTHEWLARSHPALPTGPPVGRPAATGCQSLAREEQDACRAGTPAGRQPASRRGCSGLFLDRQLRFREAPSQRKKRQMHVSCDQGQANVVVVRYLTVRRCLMPHSSTRGHEHTNQAETHCFDRNYLCVCRRAWRPVVQRKQLLFCFPLFNC